MKRLDLTPVEVRILRDMGIFHKHPHTRVISRSVSLRGDAGHLAKLWPLPYAKIVQAAKALGRMDIRLRDGPLILNVLKKTQKTA